MLTDKIFSPNVSSGHPVLMAGPCSAESCEQLLSVARAVAPMGVDLFRAGVWKPRTRPGSFEGVGEEGLRWLQVVKKETGLPVATEVATPKHVELALKHEVDVLWIGARTTTSPFAMQQIADALREMDVPVMVKNPLNPDVELWQGAIGRLEDAGIRRLAAIHRGFSGSRSDFYRNPPKWEVPMNLRRRLPHLPLFCDPSHMGGKAELVEPLARRALQIGMDGLFVEVHPNPACALSDARQQITPAQLDEMLGRLKEATCTDAERELKLLRLLIDENDEELLQLIARRLKLSQRIGLYKKTHSLTPYQPLRYHRLIATRMLRAADLGLDADFVQQLFQLIHQNSLERQQQIVDGVD